MRIWRSACHHAILNCVGTNRDEDATPLSRPQTPPPSGPEISEIDQPRSAEKQRRSWPRSLLRWSPLILLILGGIAIAILGFNRFGSLSAIVEGRAALLDYVDERPFATIIIYSGAYILAVVFSVPGGSFLTIVGGVLFGGLAGGLITTVAATIGSVCVFLIAKTALGDWMRQRAMRMGPRIANITESFRTNAFYVLVVLRLVPVMPYWASNAVPALFGVRLSVFFAATLVGLMPWTVSFAFFGAALNEIVAAQEVANPGCAEAGTCELNFSAVSLEPILIGVGIALLSLTPIVIHWWNERKKRPVPDAKADI